MEPSVERNRPRARGPSRGAADLYTRCRDCGFMIIKNGPGEWVKLLGLTTICEKTSESHKPVDNPDDKV